jgi:L-threonylcarbamoyladenylate synthase
LVRILTVSDADIGLAAEALKSGLLVAFPTETVYGLGADAFNPAALAKVFEAKNRPRFDPLIIHIARVEGLELAADLELLEGKARQQTRLLCGKLWPGPLTLILPKRREIPDLATAGLAAVAVRLPDHPAARKLIARSTGAVAAPSANPFGRLSPTQADHVRDQLGDRVDLILDGGRTRVGLESTVLDMTSPVPRILRPGGISREQIEGIIGPLAPDSRGAGPPLSLPAASPGMLKSHYAPRTPLSVHPREEMLTPGCRPGEGLLFFDGASRDAWLGLLRGGRGSLSVPLELRPGAEPVYRVLSVTGDLSEAAARLFELLHDLDRLGLSHIRAELVPDTGLGPAINDRLRRAQGAQGRGFAKFS